MFHFENRSFGTRKPAVMCAVLVLHQPKINKHDHPHATAAAIVTCDGTVYVGLARCNPKDNFERTTGRVKAIGRAASNCFHDKPSMKVDVTNDEASKNVLNRLTAEIESSANHNENINHSANRY